eukprot:TRINITY_DN18819_c0_g1_i1.p1 TRINITY_DN18819_c0_g1~~TRINITY_DN18819_c0_g1_i1.p1  ORF type:complete len:555 (+),score=88.48 TRINITY_DN18819_c0_g1_i1:151-1815(+)
MSLVEADPDPFEFDDAACCAMVSDLLKDSEEQTDVPAEPDRPASLNESEEERRSPEAQRWYPGSSSFSDRRAELGLSDRPPPGLALLSTQAPQSRFVGSAGFATQCHESVQPFNPVVSIADQDHAAAEESGNEDDEADDERSHQSTEAGQKPPSTFEPPGLGGASGISPLLGTIAGLEQADEATRLWYAQLPSIGSARHWTGACDRCCFHPKGRCLNGYNCEHCHFEHEKRKRKSKKKNKDGEMFPESPGRSAPVSPQDQALKPVGLLPAQADYHTPQEHKAVHQLLPTDMGYCPQSPHSFGPGSSVGPLPLSSLNAPSCGMGAVGYDRDNRWTAGVDFVSEAAAASVSTAFAATGAVESDPRNEYIRQLEAENHHLRMTLMSMDPSITLPPPACPPSQLMLVPKQQSPTGPASQDISNSSAVAGIATNGQQLAFGPPKPLAQPAAAFGTTGQEPSASYRAGQASEGLRTNPESGGSVVQSGGLCASAAPFCPGRYQAWGQPASGDAPLGDASTRLTGFMTSPALGGVEEVSLAAAHVATSTLGWPAQEAVQGR